MKNEHIEELIKQFKEQESVLNEMKDFILNFLRDKICVENKILLAGLEGRVKTEKSLRGKLELKGDKYKNIFDITDLFGARVITFYNDEVDFVASLLEKFFEIDYENSIDKRKLYEVDRFGYMSLHYICKIPKKLYENSKFADINNIRFEIQIRTCLQHAWATIFHDIGYKSDVEVPKEYIRRFARLEGLLELADGEFHDIRDSVNEYRKKIRSLVSSGNFKDVSLSIDSFRNYLELDPFRKLIEKIASINNADVEEADYTRYYGVLHDLGFKTLAEVEQMRVDYSDLAYRLSLIQLNGMDIDILSSTIAIQNLLIIYIVKKGGGKADVTDLLKKMSKTGQVTERYVDRIIEQTKGLIMI